MQLDSGTWAVVGPLSADAGGFGKVYEVTHTATAEAAVAKFVPKAPGAEREVAINDFARVSELEYVVPIIDRGEHQDQWVLVMPRASKSLRQHLDAANGALGLDEAVAVLGDVAQALAAIDGEIVHRDLKPANVLYLNDRWCLADFGLAKYAEAATAQETWKGHGTAPYTAPEQWTYETWLFPDEGVASAGVAVPG